ncbi:galactose-3-O-sulfotransferase 2-like [Watersipora subatra]|uniref:galactose-3-O-sulfotransferase 2-like n=1 Tax=Watersipora subatra TaxID=2589382 RepID=UPI00355B5460
MESQASLSGLEESPTAVSGVTRTVRTMISDVGWFAVTAAAEVASPGQIEVILGLYDAAWESQSGSQAWRREHLVPLGTTPGLIGSLGNQIGMERVSSSHFIEKSTYVRHFVLTKVEKAASSTMFSILARFIIRHNLTVLTSLKGSHISWNPQDFSIGPGNASQADALINHAIYDRSMMSKYIMPDYKHVALVREPVSWFKSACKYFLPMRRYEIRQELGAKFHGQQHPEEVVFDNDVLLHQRTEKYGSPQTYLHLNQLQWYGFNYADRHNLTAIKDFVSSLVSRVDVIILKDKFDASLLILKKRFRWSYLDIFYNSFKLTPIYKVRMSDRAIKRLLSESVNLGDKLLYDSMNQTWWQQHELTDDKFWDEVSYFTRLNQQVNEYCKINTNRTTQVFEISANRWHETIRVTQEICSYLILSGSGKDLIFRIADYSQNKL